MLWHWYFGWALGVLLFIALATFCRGEIPRSEPVRDTAAVVEVNWLYDGEGKLIFQQLILWDEAGGCIAWKLIKEGKPMPVRDWRGGGYVVLWSDGDLLREVRARTFVETFTQHDPEIANRESLPKEFRRQLTTPAVKRGAK